MNHLKNYQYGVTPQTEQADPRQVENNAGGFTFEVDPMMRVRRFLVMGSEGTFYQPGDQLTRENAKHLESMIIHGHANEVTDLIVEYAVGGRAAKLDYGLFALAMVAALAPTDEEKAYAYSKVPKVCRTASSLFSWMGYFHKFRRGGNGFRKAVARWYRERGSAYQVVKYRNRAGFTHRDALRLAHPEATSNEQQALFKYIVSGDTEDIHLDRIVDAFETAQASDNPREVVDLIENYGLTWEMVPTGMLNDPNVLKALLPRMPYAALVRNLTRYSKAGLTAPLSETTKTIVDKLTNEELIIRSGIHPLNILIGMKGCQTNSDYNSRVVQALESAYHVAFKNVEPTGKRYYLGIDVSGSMSWNYTSSNLSAAEASAALAAVTLKTEEQSVAYAFSAGHMGELPAQYADSVTDALRITSRYNFGATDLAMPMLDAIKRDLDVDVFVVYTDNETYAGLIHPYEALKAYRKHSGIHAKLIVVGMTSTEFTIADPEDAGMMDIAGFDSALPQIIKEFVSE